MTTFRKRGGNPDAPPPAPLPERNSFVREPGDAVPAPPRSLEEEALGVSPERILGPETEQNYSSYGQRLAGRLLQTGYARTLREERDLVHRAKNYDAAEQGRVMQMTDADRARHVERIERMREVLDDTSDELTDLITNVKRADVTVAEAVGRLQALERQLESLLVDREVMARSVARTELIREHPHRYMDLFYSRNRLLARPGLDD